MKQFIWCAAIVAMATTFWVEGTKKQEPANDLTLENIEALATTESEAPLCLGDGCVTCPGTNVKALANNEDPTYGTGVCFRVFTETDINDPKVFGIVKCNGCEHVWVNSINEGTRGDCGPIKG